MSKQHFTDDFVLAIQKDSTLDEQAKSIIFETLPGLKTLKSIFWLLGQQVAENPPQLMRCLMQKKPR